MTESMRFDDLKALFINCTLKRSPERSHTQGLIEISTGIMTKHGIQVEVLRAIDHDIATGVWPDMTEHGWATDEWPQLYAKVMAADILVLAGPIWLGDNSSVTKQVIERLYACSSLLNEAAFSTSATRSRCRPTPAGSAPPAPDRPIWIPDRVVPRTTSPTATPRS